MSIKVRKIDMGHGYKYAVLKGDVILDTFLTLQECYIFIKLMTSGIIDEDNFSTILPAIKK